MRAFRVLAAPAKRQFTNQMAMSSRMAMPALSFPVRQKHTIKPLPYDVENGVGAAISPEALWVHYHKHHQGHVDSTNKLLKGTEYEHESLVDIATKLRKGGVREGKMSKADLLIYNQVAQVLNHEYFFEGMQTGKAKKPTGKMLELIKRDWKSLKALRKEFDDHAMNLFGSGWTWIVECHTHGGLEVVNSTNEGTPIANPRVTPLLCIDLWEHSYYIDYSSRREAYLDNWWKVVNWEEVNRRLKASPYPGNK
jgi:Fe-Mn family superoxide dismutase